MTWTVFCHFQFSFCFPLDVEDEHPLCLGPGHHVGQQAGRLPHFPAMMDSCPSGTRSLNQPVLLSVASVRGVLSPQQKSNASSACLCFPSAKTASMHNTSHEAMPLWVWRCLYYFAFQWLEEMLTGQHWGTNRNADSIRFSQP